MKHVKRGKFGRPYPGAGTGWEHFTSSPCKVAMEAATPGKFACGFTLVSDIGFPMPR